MTWMIVAFIWKYGIGAVLVGVAVAVAMFTTFKKEAIIAACVVALGMAVFTLGVNDGKNFEKAKWDAAIARVDKQVGDAVTGAKSDVDGGVRDRFDNDQN